MPIIPQLKLFFGASTTQDDISATWTSGAIDTNDAFKKFTIPYDQTPIEPVGFEGDWDSEEWMANMVNSPDDPKTWYYVLDMDSIINQPGDPINQTIGIPDDPEWDGYVWVQIKSNDRAGNIFNEDSLSFGNSVLLDNTVPTATITYANQRDSLLTIAGSNPDSSYCCFAIAGDQVVVKVMMNEPIKSLNPIPKLGGRYNSNNGFEFSNVEPDSSNADATTGTVDTLYYTITIVDSVQNDGILVLNLDASDRTGTEVTKYDDSPQKQGSIESRFALEIDNIHPFGYADFPIFDDPQPTTVTFPTDTLWTKGYRVVDGWINKLTDSVIVKVPYNQQFSDSTLYGNVTWGPIGKIDMQVKNLDIFQNDWQNIGDSENIIPQGAVLHGGWNYIREVSRSIGELDTASYSIGNRLLFRAVLTDRNGNVTYGQTSDGWKTTDERLLYGPDSLNADTVRYDIIVPSLGEWNGGNFNEAGPIISNDTITLSWSEFTDPGGALASGVDIYEMQI